MSLSNIKTQKEYFYKKPWGLKLDGLFLSHINNHLVEYGGATQEDVDHAVCLAGIDINSSHGLNLDVDEVQARYMHLKQRWEAWTLVLKDPNTIWDVDNGFVHAKEETWLRLFEKNKMVKAYLNADEPHYGKLALVFAMIKQQEVSEEVDSPVVPSRRRLFDEEKSEPPEAGSSNSVPVARPPRKPDENLLHERSSTSSSPIMWWKA